MLGLIVAAACTHVRAAEPPLRDSDAVEDWKNLVRIPGEQTIKRLRIREGHLQSQSSTDGGKTWGAEVNEFSVEGGSNPIPTIDAEGDLNIIRLLKREQFVEVWHQRTDGENGVTQPVKIYGNAYVPAMVSAICLSQSHPKAGRLIVPFGLREAMQNPPPPTGHHYTLVAYSDDRGATWKISPSELRSHTLIHADGTLFNGRADGFVWQTLVELKNGDVYMLARSASGFLYESTSHDGGETWETARPSRFYASIALPRLLRLDDGRLVLIWNNCTNPPRYQNPETPAPRIWYCGRDALHAAVSDDDGKTWRGFREIYLAPNRNEVPEKGDSGTAATFAVSTADSKVLMITGQQIGRTMIHLDPNWLLETRRSEEFKNGLEELCAYKTYGPVGVPHGVKRARTLGVALSDDADPKLHLRKPDEKAPDGVNWNFPMAQQGQTKLKIKLNPGGHGATISLTDRYFEPTHSQGEEIAFFRIDIAGDGTVANGKKIAVDQWHELIIDWDINARQAIVRLGDEQIATIAAQKDVQVWPGLSYLRLRSAAKDDPQVIDAAGFLVDEVSHESRENHE